MNLVNEEDIPCLQICQNRCKISRPLKHWTRVDFRAAPISCATILARVVLPRPGGPKISVWSRGSERFRAASTKSCICSRTLGWPSYSASMFWSHGAFDAHILGQRVALYNPLFHGVLSICFRLARIRPSGVVSGSVDTKLIALRASDSL